MKFKCNDGNTLWAIFVLVIISPAQAYVTPKIGRGQQGGFPMIMPEILFNG